MSEADNVFPDNDIGAIKPIHLRTFAKYLLAAYNRVHMLTDDEGLGDLDPLDGGATQAEANARAEVLRVSMIAHMDSVGTPTVDGDHLALDPINRDILTAIPTLTDLSPLGDCITLVQGLNTALKAHQTQPGVHFHDAVATAGTPFYPLAECNLEISAQMPGPTYTMEVINRSGGLIIGDLNEDNLPSFLFVTITLPQDFEQATRITKISFRIVTDENPPDSVIIDPFLPYSYEITGLDNQAIIAIPLTSPPDAPITRTIGVSYTLAVASTPLGDAMSIDPPTTLGHVITDLNELLVSFLAHFQDG